MKLDVNMVMKDITGQALRIKNVSGEEEEMTLGHVLVQMALQAPGPNKSYTPEEQVARYHLALDTQQARAQTPSEIEIGLKVAAWLRCL